MPQRHTAPILFGEVLFDQFEDGSSVLGGAPFNVAWHLAGFGADPLLISRVGEDAAAQQLRQQMARWGLSAAALQSDPHHPTGTVTVALQQGQPHFTINPEQAYDYIDSSAALTAAATRPATLLYHGTLAARGDSAAALMALRQRYATFVDVNIRPPWWQPEAMIPLLQGSAWVKLNDMELLEIDAALTSGHDRDRAANSPLPDSVQLVAIAESLQQRLAIEQLIITRGARGAILLTAAGVSSSAPPVVNHLRDTVGAGDAFSAVMLLGELRQWPQQQSLQRALEFAAAICTQRGATPQQRSFYTPFIDAWQLD